jgi:amphi-Trp domain-containing protein
MPEDRDVDVVHDLPSFVAELRRLADALESGTAFTIHLDGEDVTIPDDAQFSIAHEREDGEVELEFQVTWSSSEDEDETHAQRDGTDEQEQLGADPA